MLHLKLIFPHEQYCPSCVSDADLTLNVTFDIACC
jgi:hypothetical protein